MVVHLYNSTSFAQRQQVFRMSEDEIVDIAVSGAKLFDEYAAKMPETNFRFEYSPESFTRHGRWEFAPADLQRRHRRVEAPAGAAGDHQPPLHRGDVHAPCLCPAD